MDGIIIVFCGGCGVIQGTLDTVDRLEGEDATCTNCNHRNVRVNAIMGEFSEVDASRLLSL